MTLRPPPRLVDDPSVADALRRELGQFPKSAAMPSGYDVAAGLARFEASMGGTSGASGSGSGGVETVHSAAGSGVATGHSAVGGLGTAVTAGAGLKGTLMICAALGLAAVGAGVAGLHFYGRSTDARVAVAAATAPVAAASLGVVTSAPVAAASLGVATSAPVVASASSTTDIPRDTELELIQEPKSTKLRPAASTMVPRRAAKAIEPSAPSEGVTETEQAPSAADAPLKTSRSMELAEEMEQLTRLRALVSNDPAAALRLCEQGHQRFPKGLFQQEREAIAIQSLAQLHRTSEAKRRARAFEAAYPRSPFLARMSQLLGSNSQ